MIGEPEVFREIGAGNVGAYELRPLALAASGKSERQRNAKREHQGTNEMVSGHQNFM